MLKKVAGAAPNLKDKLKYRLHHGHAPPPTGSSGRHGSKYRGGGKQAAMSFSAVDNDAFEQILDDNTDFNFIAVRNTPPTRPPATKGSGVAWPDNNSRSTTDGQHSDLFDADIFDSDEDEMPLASSVGENPSPPGGPQPMVNYDPLSGQIVSQLVSSGSSEGDSSGIETGNETGPQHEEGVEYDRNGIGDVDIPAQQSKGKDEIMSEVNSNEREASLDVVESGELEEAKLEEAELDRSGTGLNGVEPDGGEAEIVEIEAEGKALEVDLHDYLFDEVPPPTEDTPQLPSQVSEGSPKQELEPVDDMEQLPLSTAGDITEVEPTDSKLQNDIDVPRSFESPVSSVPSSVEADTYSAEFPAKHPTGDKENIHDQVSGIGSSPRSASSTHQREMRSHADSSTSNLEELERLLAPRSVSPTRVGVSTGETHRRRVVAERASWPDGMGGSRESPLDSGVYEHEGREISDTSGSEGAEASVSHTDGENFLIHDDHFTRPMDRSSSVPTTTFHTCPPSNTSNQSKRNSSGKVPPPRPPISPQVERRRMKYLNSASREGAEDKVEVKLVKPLGRIPVVDSQPGKVDHGDGVRSEEVVGVKEQSDDNDLFPDDVRKIREMDELAASKNLAMSQESTSKTLDTTTPEGSETISSETPEVRQESEFDLPFPYHLLLSLVLYLYYSLNTFPYLAGLFAGFLMLFLFLGSVFIYYVQTIEKEREERQQERKEAVQVSEGFVQTMKVDFSKLKEYQSNKFTATLKYDSATHHPSQRMPAELSLKDDFKFFVQMVNKENNMPMLCKYVDIRQCKVSIEPAEVAQNRKRRWSKKFPIMVSCVSGPKKFKVYLFSPTARGKEDWFRRMKSASSGVTSLELIRRQREFFGYMEKYFPEELLKALSLTPQKYKKQQVSSHRQHNSRSAVTQQRVADTLVQFSKSTESDDMPSSEDPELGGGVNITRKSSNIQSGNKVMTSSQSSVRGHSSTRLPSVDEMGFEHVQYPSPSATRRRIPGNSDVRSNQWLNSLAARLCWDIWHEKRWKDWVMAKIEKKLIRIKTPSFMEQLCLTDIDVGNDMPMINRLIGGPYMDLRGIWVYLDVTYRGKFVMTIETKMKLGGGSEKLEEGQPMMAMSRSKDGSSLPMNSPLSAHHAKSSRTLSHTQAAHALAGGGDGTSVDPGEEIDSGSDDEEGNSSLQHHPLLEEDLTNSQEELLSQGHTPSPGTADSDPPPSSGKARIKSMVTRVAKKVANTKFVRRAAEKVSNYSLVLTVEVNKLDGILAVNIPPPPSDTVWWGFHGSPKLELVAKPKVGHREVKFSRVTHWIEKKLCDIVDKKLVLPEMEDLVVPVLNSGMDEDKLTLLKPISGSSDSGSATPTT